MEDNERLFDKLWDDYERLIRRITFLVDAAYCCDGQGKESFSNAIGVIDELIEGKAEWLEEMQKEQRVALC